MADAKLSLLSAVVATGAGSTKRVAVPNGKEYVPVLIRGITTATVAIQGSLDGTNWVTIVSKTADFAGLVEGFPYMRGNVTAWTEGTIYADIWADVAFG